MWRSHGEIDGTYVLATRLTRRALLKTRKLPHSTYRVQAIDNLEAAIGWIKQAHDEWAQAE